MYGTPIFFFFEYRTINSNELCIDCVISYNAVEYIVNITDLEKKIVFLCCCPPHIQGLCHHNGFVRFDYNDLLGLYYSHTLNLIMNIRN